MIKIRYTIIFSAIFLLIVYQLLLSFNVLPYFFTGQDIIILLIFLISIFLFFIAHALEKISAKLYEPGQSIAVSVNTEDYLPPDFQLPKKLEKKDFCKYFIAMQNYLRGFNDIKELTDKLIVAVAKITHSERASILLYNKKKDELYIYRTLGWNSSEIKLITKTKIKPGEGIAGRVFLDGKPVVMNETEGKREFGLKDKYKSNSFISLPVFSGNTIIGVLNLTEKENDTYSRHEIDMVNFIINEASLHLFYIMKTTKEKL